MALYEAPFKRQTTFVTDSVKSRRNGRLESLETWRKVSEEDSRKSQDQFDRALMTLSASGIGATLAFLDKIVPFQQAVPKWLLYLIWVFWGACLASTVFSFYASNKGLLRAQQQIADEWRAVRDAKDPDQVDATTAVGGGWNTATNVLNEIAAVFFLCGLVAMVVFIGYNLFAMPDKSSTSNKVNEGTVASARPPQAVPNTKGLPVAPRPPAAQPPRKDK